MYYRIYLQQQYLNLFLLIYISNVYYYICNIILYYTKVTCSVIQLYTNISDYKSNLLRTVYLCNMISFIIK